MALVNSAFSVNVTPGAMPPTVHVSEYDIGRTYTVTINGQNGSAFNIPTGTTATVEGTLNGAVGFTQSATVSNNQVSFTLSESMTAYSGKAWCKIKLTQNSQPIQTCAFVLAVDRAGVEAETVIGAPGFEEQIQDAVDAWLDDHDPIFTLPEGGQSGQALLSDGADGAVWGLPSGSGLSDTEALLLLRVLNSALLSSDEAFALNALKRNFQNTSENTVTVTNNLTNATTENNATSIKSGNAYYTTIEVASGYDALTVSVTVGGVSQTVEYISATEAEIKIQNCTGAVVITAVGSQSGGSDWDFEWDASSGVVPTGMVGSGFTFSDGLMFAPVSGDYELDFNYYGDCTLEVVFNISKSHISTIPNNPQFMVCKAQNAGAKTYVSDTKNLFTNASGSATNLGIDCTTLRTVKLVNNNGDFTVYVDGIVVANGNGVANNQYMQLTGIYCGSDPGIAARFKSIKFRRGA